MTDKTNILLVTVDSLRADHLGCYGYDRLTSPFIDAIASQGVVCDAMFCAAIPTQPSYTTLYTGQHPIRHGIVGQGGYAKLSPHAPFLPELFLKAGYTTAGFDTLMRDRLWFGRGYEYYIDSSLRRILRLGVSCEEINVRAIPWMREHQHEPFFMFLHYWDPHTPYQPPDRYRKLFYDGNPTDPDNHSLDGWWDHPFGSLAQDTWLRMSNGEVVTDANYVTALYDQEVKHVDEGIGALLQALDDLNLTENTLVLIIGDHGESMTEHGIFFEHHGLYDCTLRIPCIARMPGTLPAGVRLPQLLQHHDIASTLLEATRLATPRAMDGQSFWPALTGGSSDGRSEVIALECSMQAKWCLRTLDYKFILAREPDFYGTPMRELYDLRADPHEEHNIAPIRSDVADALEAQLEQWIDEHLKAAGRKLDPLREQGVSLQTVIDAH